MEKLLAPAVASSRPTSTAKLARSFSLDVDARTGVNFNNHFLHPQPKYIYPWDTFRILPPHSITMAASMFQQSGNGTLFLGGQKISGTDIRDQNGKPSRSSADTWDTPTTDCHCQSSQLRLLQMLSRAPSALAASTR